MTAARDGGLHRDPGVTIAPAGVRPLHQDPVEQARRHWQDKGWGEAAEGMAAVTAVMRTHQILLTRAEAVLKPFGLTFARFELLALLSFTASGALPMAKAGARLQVHPTSVTNAVDRLEKAGLVERRRHPSDGRTVLVEITQAGRELVPPAASALNAEVFSRSGFTADDLTVLTDILARFRRDAGDFADPEGKAQVQDQRWEAGPQSGPDLRFQKGGGLSP